MAHSSYDDACCYPHLDSAWSAVSSLLRRVGAEIPRGSRGTGAEAFSWWRPRGTKSAKRVASADSLISTNCGSEGDDSSRGDQSEVEFEEISGQVQQADLDRAFREIGRMRQWDKARWEVEEILGPACGQHGSVARMRLVQGRGAAGPEAAAGAAAELVAVKTAPRRWLTTSPEDFRRVHGPTVIEFPWQDICIMRHLNTLHYPYACELMGIFVGSDKAHIMTSLATKGDLFAWSAGSAHQPGAAREASMRPLLRQVFTAVRWLHDLGIAHRDLSLENILLTDSGDAIPQVKIIDFGMATLQPRRSRGVRGKRSYQAPEMHEAFQPYDGLAADAFALGVVLFAMSCARYPWKTTRPGGCPAFELMKLRGFSVFLVARSKSFEDDAQKPLNEALSAPCRALMKGLLTLRPDDRWTVGEVCVEDALTPAERRCSVWDSDWLKQHDVLEVLEEEPEEELEEELEACT